MRLAIKRVGRGSPAREPCTLVMAVIATVGVCQPAGGDIFHLKGGGTVEGDVRSSDNDRYIRRTAVGTFTLQTQTQLSEALQALQQQSSDSATGQPPAAVQS